MKISIIGCGNMGSALAQRLSQTHRLFLYDHNIEKLKHFEEQGFGKPCKDIKEAISIADMVILAIKPQNFKQLSKRLEPKLIVSLLAGTPISTLKNTFPKATIVRMMPNLALVYGEGVIGLSSDENLEKEMKNLISKTFSILGKAFWIPEEKMDALTALTGAGPAFFFTMIEAMIDAGIAMGFPVKTTQELVYQMLHGSLTLLEKSQKHPGELRWQIASPQGITIAGLRKLEELALRGSIINTFLAAYEYGCELSSQSRNNSNFEEILKEEEVLEETLRN